MTGQAVGRETTHKVSKTAHARQGKTRRALRTDSAMVLDQERLVLCAVRYTLH